MIFISATDTDVGKTYFSSWIIRHLRASETFKREELAYYKPVQSGPEKDYKVIEKDVGVDFYCSYDFKIPASPDFAASQEDTWIRLEKIKEDFEVLKSKYKFIVVEGAGGLMVPLNDQDLVSDIPVALDLPMYLVIRPNLGTINHTLLSVEHAKTKEIETRALIVAKDEEMVSHPEFYLRNKAALESIKKFTGLELYKNIEEIDFNCLKNTN